SATPVHTSVATGLPDSASKVAAPTNRSAASVGTTVTWWPASASSRTSSAALYAAMPPATPSSTSATRSAFGGLAGQQAVVDLPEGDGQRLLLRRGLHQGADVLQQPLAELAVVGVDLARTLGGIDDQTVLRARLGQQLVDGRVGDALRGCGGTGHAGQPSRFGSGYRINCTNSSAARPTSSLTMVTSNSASAASSIF